MTIKEINEDIEEGEALKTIASVYTEIASLKLRRIRQEVLKSRAFFSEISTLYALVKRIAPNPSARSRSSLGPKTASVILTSNNHFYGHIDTNIVQLFLKKNLGKGDVFVVGSAGKQALMAIKFNQFKSFIFKKDLPLTAELKGLVDAVKQYEEVYVYFAQFQTVANQIPVVVDITQHQPSAISHQPSDKNKSDDWRLKTESSFIFEPEVAKILGFFDSQIKQTLLEQTFLESELARVGSRLIFMDQAQHNADDFVTGQIQLLNQAKKSIQNTRLLEIISSIRSFRNQI